MPDPGETVTNPDTAADVAIVRSFWKALSERDFDAVGAHMAPDGHYVDVAVKDTDPGARGPAATSAGCR